MDIDLGTLGDRLRPPIGPTGPTGPTVAPTAGPRSGTDRRFPPSFMRDHTQFDSFAAFRARSPAGVAVEAAFGARSPAPDRLDRYVARTTEFDDWAEMDAAAAVDDLVELFGVRDRW